MVPVNVAQEQVKVSDAQVSVKIRDLEGQARFEKIARELQVELARIAADKDARIAAAQAFGQAMAAAHVTLWGDPSTFEKMASAFYRGQAMGTLLDGLEKSVPADVKAAASAVVSGLGGALDAVSKRVAASSETPPTPDHDGKQKAV